MKEQRKIFNYESKILLDITLEKEGHSPGSLGITSTKFIWATCRFCGESHRIRYGFFNKAGSACHKECKIKEQSLNSPFAKIEVRQKAKQTIMDKFGVEYASQNKSVAKKISETKLTKDSKEKSKNTNIEKYGVKNVFQSEEIKQTIKKSLLEKYGVDNSSKSNEIKEKIKQTCLGKYGFENAVLSKEVQDKMHSTNFERYGVPYAMQDKDISKKSIENFNKSIILDENNNYNLINTLRTSENFWDLLGSGNFSLKQVCQKFDINYQSITSRLLSEEFSEKYYRLYKFPKQIEQKRLFNLINNFGISCTMNDRSVISPLELDIYVPDKKFAIEYNGSFWHSEAFLDSKIAQKKHHTKTILCKKNGIRLFHIFEHDWINRSDQIMNFIKTILGKNSIRVGARECSVESFNNKTSKVFIQNNHIQGYGNGTIKFFDLMYNNTIIASMSASHHHRQNIKGNPIVLNRLCFKDDYNVPGGSNKLFNKFKIWAKENGYDRIISWSNNCWTEGNIYKILGFDFIKESGPDYFYYDSNNKKYISKQSQKKSNNGCPKEITERQYCYDKGIFRIWDCGKTLWEYVL